MCQGWPPPVPMASSPARRGSTPASVGKAVLPTPGRLPSERQRLQHGTWMPKGMAARAVYASCSEAGCSIDGQRKTNQDAFLVDVPHEFGPSALFGVFDGHGVHGHRVSAQVRAELAQLHERERAQQSDLHAAAVAAYLEQDRLCNAALDCAQSGTTAATCFLAVDPSTMQLKCHVAWAGDSRVVVGTAQADGSLAAVELTVDHTPDRTDERSRIEQLGGKVEPILDFVGNPLGPPRVWYVPQITPGLAMSRSIGDSVGAIVGVCAEPETAERVASPEDAFVILATDGLWQFITPEEVVTSISAQLQGASLSEEVVLSAVQSLCRLARERWMLEDPYIDDVTLTVIVLQQATPARRPPACAASPVKASPAAAAVSGATSSRTNSSPELPTGSSAPAVGITAKRGAVSCDSEALDGGEPPLRRSPKPAASRELLLEALRDPRHVFFTCLSQEAQELVVECVVETAAGARTPCPAMRPEGMSAACCHLNRRLNRRLNCRLDACRLDCRRKCRRKCRRDEWLLNCRLNGRLKMPPELPPELRLDPSPPERVTLAPLLDHK